MARVMRHWLGLVLGAIVGVTTSVIAVWLMADFGAPVDMAVKYGIGLGIVLLCAAGGAWIQARGERHEKGAALVQMRDVRARDVTINVTQAGKVVDTLHQLPAAPRDFTGRAKELEALRVAMSAGQGVKISGMRGTGGIGKTALALVLANDLAGQYPDAQLFFDLRGAKENAKPATVSEALAHVILAFDRATVLPEGEEALRALYLARLSTGLVAFARSRAAEPLVVGGVDCFAVVAVAGQPYLSERTAATGRSQ